MTKAEFEKLRDAFVGNYMVVNGQRPTTIECADWAYELLNEKLVTPLHLKRLDELGEKISENKKLKAQLAELNPELELN